METLGKILGTDSRLYFHIKKVNGDLNCLRSIHISFCVSLKKIRLGLVKHEGEYEMKEF